MFYLLDQLNPPEGKQLHSVKSHIILKIQNKLTWNKAFQILNDNFDQS